MLHCGSTRAVSSPLLPGAAKAHLHVWHIHLSLQTFPAQSGSPMGLTVCGRLRKAAKEEPMQADSIRAPVVDTPERRALSPEVTREKMAPLLASLAQLRPPQP